MLNEMNQAEGEIREMASDKCEILNKQNNEMDSIK